MRKDFIVSLTSFPARFYALPIALDSLSQQILQPKEVILNIAEKDAAQLPESVTSRIGSGSITLNLCDDLGPGKKLIPTIKMDQELPIVVVDDDLVFEPDLTLKILIQHHFYPTSIIASRAHRVTANQDGNIKPYNEWTKQWAIDNGPTADMFAIAGAGTLFPRYALHPDALNEELYKEMCLLTDDIWWYFHARRFGTNVRRVLGQRGLEFIPGTQEQGLWQTGNKTRNEENLQKMLNLYGNPLNY